MEKQKTEISGVVVIMTIFLLLVIMAAPPYFRAMFPEEDDDVVIKGNILLTCEKVDTVNKLKATSKTLYVDSKISKNTINFYPNYVAPVPVVTPTAPVEEVAPASEVEGLEETPQTVEVRTINDELEFFKSIPDLKINESDTVTTVILNQESINANNTNMELANYFLEKEEQIKIYQNLGYTCSEQEM